MEEQTRKHPDTAALAQAAAASPEERQARLERMVAAASDGKAHQKAAAAIKIQDPEQDGCPADLADSHNPPPPPPQNGQPGWPDDPQPDHHWPHHHRRHKRMSRFVRKLITTIVLLLIVIIAILIFWPRVQEALTPNFKVSLPDSLNGLLPDETMGYNRVDFSNAILGESREQKELVVMEQDVEVTSQITQDLLNISIFSKQKIIHSFGTGVYTVDLNALTADDVTLDEAACIVTVVVPHAKLTYINVDVGKTEFEDTKKSLLAVGDIKLTAEQQQLLDESVDEALNQRLSDPALLAKADEIALNKVRELFQSAVNAVSDDHIVKIVMN